MPSMRIIVRRFLRWGSQNKKEETENERGLSCLLSRFLHSSHRKKQQVQGEVNQRESPVPKAHKENYSKKSGKTIKGQVNLCMNIFRKHFLPQYPVYFLHGIYQKWQLDYPLSGLLHYFLFLHESIFDKSDCLSRGPLSVSVME